MKLRDFLPETWFRAALLMVLAATVATASEDLDPALAASASLPALEAPELAAMDEEQLALLLGAAQDYLEAEDDAGEPSEAEAFARRVDVLIGSAFAAAGDRCFVGGYDGARDSAGACAPLAKSSCASGAIACHPSLYGPDACAMPEGGKSHAACSRALLSRCGNEEDSGVRCLVEQARWVGGSPERMAEFQALYSRIRSECSAADLEPARRESCLDLAGSIDSLRLGFREIDQALELLAKETPTLPEGQAVLLEQVHGLLAVLGRGRGFSPSESTEQLVCPDLREPETTRKTWPWDAETQRRAAALCLRKASEIASDEDKVFLASLPGVNDPKLLEPALREVLAERFAARERGESEPVISGKGKKPVRPKPLVFKSDKQRQAAFEAFFKREAAKCTSYLSFSVKPKVGTQECVDYLRLIEPSPDTPSPSPSPVKGKRKAAPRPKPKPATAEEVKTCSSIEAVGSLNENDSFYARLFGRDRRAQIAFIKRQQAIAMRKLAAARAAAAKAKRQAEIARRRRNSASRSASSAQVNSASCRAYFKLAGERGVRAANAQYGADFDDLCDSVTSSGALSRTKQAIEGNTKSCSYDAGSGRKCCFLITTNTYLGCEDYAVKDRTAFGNRGGITRGDVDNRYRDQSVLFYKKELLRSETLLRRALSQQTQTLASAKKMKASLDRSQRDMTDFLDKSAAERDRILEAVMREQARTYGAAKTNGQKDATLAILTNDRDTVERAKQEIYGNKSGKSPWLIDPSSVDAASVASVKTALLKSGYRVERAPNGKGDSGLVLVDRDNAIVDLSESRKDANRAAWFGKDDTRGINLMALLGRGFADGRVKPESCPAGERDCDAWSREYKRRVLAEIQADINLLTNERYFDQDKRVQLFRNIVAQGNQTPAFSEAQKSKFNESQENSCRTRFAKDYDGYRTCVDTAPTIYTERIRQVAGSDFLPNQLWLNPELGNRLARGFGGGVQLSTTEAQTSPVRILQQKLRDCRKLPSGAEECERNTLDGAIVNDKGEVMSVPLEFSLQDGRLTGEKRFYEALVQAQQGYKRKGRWSVNDQERTRFAATGFSEGAVARYNLLSDKLANADCAKTAGYGGKLCERLGDGALTAKEMSEFLDLRQKIEENQADETMFSSVKLNDGADLLWVDEKLRPLYDQLSQPGTPFADPAQELSYLAFAAKYHLPKGSQGSRLMFAKLTGQDSGGSDDERQRLSQALDQRLETIRRAEKEPAYRDQVVSQTNFWGRWNRNGDAFDGMELNVTGYATTYRKPSAAKIAQWQKEVDAKSFNGRDTQLDAGGKTRDLTQRYATRVSTRDGQEVFCPLDPKFNAFQVAYQISRCQLTSTGLYSWSRPSALAELNRDAKVEIQRQLDSGRLLPNGRGGTLGYAFVADALNRGTRSADPNSSSQVGDTFTVFGSEQFRREYSRRQADLIEDFRRTTGRNPFSFVDQTPEQRREAILKAKSVRMLSLREIVARCPELPAASGLLTGSQDGDAKLFSAMIQDKDLFAGCPRLAAASPRQLVAYALNDLLMQEAGSGRFGPNTDDVRARLSRMTFDEIFKGAELFDENGHLLTRSGMESFFGDYLSGKRNSLATNGAITQRLAEQVAEEKRKAIRDENGRYLREGGVIGSIGKDFRRVFSLDATVGERLRSASCLSMGLICYPAESVYQVSLPSFGQGIEQLVGRYRGARQWSIFQGTFMEGSQLDLSIEGNGTGTRAAEIQKLREEYAGDAFKRGFANGIMLNGWLTYIPAKILPGSAGRYFGDITDYNNRPVDDNLAGKYRYDERTVASLQSTGQVYSEVANAAGQFVTVTALTAGVGSLWSNGARLALTRAFIQQGASSATVRGAIRAGIREATRLAGRTLTGAEVRQVTVAVIERTAAERATAIVSSAAFRQGTEMAIGGGLMGMQPQGYYKGADGQVYRGVPNEKFDPSLPEGPDNERMRPESWEDFNKFLVKSMAIQGAFQGVGAGINRATTGAANTAGHVAAGAAIPYAQCMLESGGADAGACVRTAMMMFAQTMGAHVGMKFVGRGARTELGKRGFPEDVDLNPKRTQRELQGELLATQALLMDGTLGEGAIRQLTEREAKLQRRLAEFERPQLVAGTEPKLLTDGGGPKLLTDGSEQRPQIPPRRHPPIGRSDTVMFNIFTNEVTSVHGKGTFISDAEILRISEIKRTEPLGDAKIEFTENGKALIQQQATRGCTAACTEMLIVDSGGKADLELLQNTNLGDTDSMSRRLKQAGFEPVVKVLESQDGDVILRELAKRIEDDGSAIVSVGGEIGGHVVVVDRVDLARGRVTIREPYHGWEIEISTRSLLKRIGGRLETVQIDAPGSRSYRVKDMDLSRDSRGGIVIRRSREGGKFDASGTGTFDELLAHVQKKAFRDALQGVEILPDGAIRFPSLEAMSRGLASSEFQFKNFAGGRSQSVFSRRFDGFAEPVPASDAVAPEFFYTEAQFMEAIARGEIPVAGGGSALPHELWTHLMGWTLVGKDELGYWKQHANDVIELSQRLRFPPDMPLERRRQLLGRFYQDFIEQFAKRIDEYTADLQHDLLQKGAVESWRRERGAVERLTRAQLEARVREMGFELAQDQKLVGEISVGRGDKGEYVLTDQRKPSRLREFVNRRFARSREAFDRLSRVVSSAAFRNRFPSASTEKRGTIVIPSVAELNAGSNSSGLAFVAYFGDAPAPGTFSALFDRFSARNQDSKTRSPDQKYSYTEAQFFEELSQGRVPMAQDGPLLVHDLQDHLLGWASVTKQQRETWRAYAREVLRIGKSLPESARAEFFEEFVRMPAQQLDDYSAALQAHLVAGGYAASFRGVPDPITAATIDRLAQRYAPKTEAERAAQAREIILEELGGQTPETPVEVQIAGVERAHLLGTAVDGKYSAADIRLKWRELRRSGVSPAAAKRILRSRIAGEFVDAAVANEGASPVVVGDVSRIDARVSSLNSTSAKSPLDLQYSLLFAPELGGLVDDWVAYVDREKSSLAANDGLRELKPYGTLPKLAADASAPVEARVVNGKLAAGGAFVDGIEIPFAILPDGTWRIGKPGDLFELPLTGGGRVLAVGRMNVQDGQIKLISDDVEHYRPTPRFMQQALDRFARQGLDVANVQVAFRKSRQWIRDFAPLRDEWKRQRQVDFDRFNEISPLVRGRIEPPPVENRTTTRRDVTQLKQAFVEQNQSALRSKADLLKAWGDRVLEIVPDQVHNAAIDKLSNDPNLSIVYLEHGYIAEGNKPEIFGHDLNTAMINAYQQAFRWTLDQPEYAALKTAIGDNLAQSYKYIAFGLDLRDPKERARLTRMAEEFQRSVGMTFEAAVEPYVAEARARMREAGTIVRLPDPPRFLYRAAIAHPGDGFSALDLAARKAKAMRTDITAVAGSSPWLNEFGIADYQKAYQRSRRAETFRQALVKKFRGTDLVDVDGNFLSYGAVSVMRQILKRGPRPDDEAFFKQISDELTTKLKLPKGLFTWKVPKAGEPPSDAEMFRTYYNTIDDQTPVILRKRGPSEQRQPVGAGQSTVIDADISGLSARNFNEGERANYSVVGSLTTVMEIDFAKRQIVHKLYDQTRANLRGIDEEMASEYGALFAKLRERGLTPKDQVESGDDARIVLSRLTAEQKQKLAQAAADSLRRPARLRLVETLEGRDLDGVAKLIQERIALSRPGDPIRALEDVAMVISTDESGAVVVYVARRGGKAITLAERAMIAKLVSELQPGAKVYGDPRPDGLTRAVFQSDLGSTRVQPEDNGTVPAFIGDVGGVDTPRTWAEIQVGQKYSRGGKPWIVVDKNPDTGEIHWNLSESGRIVSSETTVAPREYTGEVIGLRLAVEFRYLQVGQLVPLERMGLGKIESIDTVRGVVRVRGVGNNRVTDLFARTKQKPATAAKIDVTSADDQFWASYDATMDLRDQIYTGALADSVWRPEWLARESELVRRMAASLRARGIGVEVIPSTDGGEGIALKIAADEKYIELAKQSKLPVRILSYLSRGERKVDLFYDPSGTRRQSMGGALEPYQNRLLLGMSWTPNHFLRMGSVEVHEVKHLTQARAKGGASRRLVQMRDILLNALPGGELPSQGRAIAGYGKGRSVDEVEARLAEVGAYLASSKNAKVPARVDIERASAALAEAYDLVGADLFTAREALAYLKKSGSGARKEYLLKRAWRDAEGNQFAEFYVSVTVPGGKQKVLGIDMPYAGFSVDIPGATIKLPKGVDATKLDYLDFNDLVEDSAAYRQSAHDFAVGQLSLLTRDRAGLLTALGRYMTRQTDSPNGKFLNAKFDKPSRGRIEDAMRRVRDAQRAIRTSLTAKEPRQ